MKVRISVRDPAYVVTQPPYLYGTVQIDHLTGQN
jgi:hypothetical protein